MPIDFPTRKLADRATTTPTAPAADDTLQGQTALGTDRVFLLGNLAGLASLTIANDQAPYFAGGAWGSYSLTAAGRSLAAVAGTANTFPYFSAANVVTLGAVGATGLASLAAANVAAGRAAIGAVGLTGDEVISGIKTFSSPSSWFRGASIGQVDIGSPGGLPGFNLYTGTYPGGSYSRADVRGGVGLMSLGSGVANTGAGPTNLFQITPTSIRPSSNNTMSCGEAANAWTEVRAQNTTISTSDARFKTDPRQLHDSEFNAASAIARLPAVWRWLSRVHGDENCEPEGREARKHFGPTVQAAIAVMESHGLDPFAYSFICYDQWEALEEKWHEWPAADAVIDEEGNVLEPAVEAGRELVQPAREAGDRYSFRKEELLCFLVAAMARQHDELADRVAALEAKLTA